MPLDSMNQAALDPGRKRKIEELTSGKAKLAIDLIEYDPKFEAAMRQVFGYAWVCADQESAKNVCFKQHMVSVTMQGEKYSPDGIMHGGYVAQGGELLLKIQAYI